MHERFESFLQVCLVVFSAQEKKRDDFFLYYSGHNVAFAT